MMCRKCNGRMSPGDGGWWCEECGNKVPFNSKTHHETRKATDKSSKDGEKTFVSRD